MLCRNNKTSATAKNNKALVEAHRVVAALADNDSVGKGLVVDLNAERPVSVILRVLLDKVQVVNPSNLHTEKNKKNPKNSD